MKYIELETLVTKAAELTKFNAGCEGIVGDGGAKGLLQELDRFKWSIIFDKDLRPSEWDNNIEIGFPKQFQSWITWITKIDKELSLSKS